MREFPFAKIVGLFVISAGLVAATALVGLGINQGWIVPKITLFAVFDEAEYIKPGDPVTLSGFKVGEVGKLSLTEDLKVVAQLKIERRYMFHITSGAIARPEPPLLIGQGKIRLHPGTSLTPLARGDTLLTGQTEGIAILISSVQEILETADAAINNLLEISGSVAAMTQEFSHPDSSMNRILRATAKLAEDLSSGDGLIPALMSDMTFKMRIDSTLIAAADASRELALIMGNMDQLLSSADSLLFEVGSLARLVEESAPRLAQELVPVLRELRLTLEKTRSSWLLGGQDAKSDESPGQWRMGP